ncbi:major facilitator superfamily domain-containing protein [Massariosphaeria phaeospora]|uniref:Major facilitator superfamily domain-containing protein n=1 Tax=Massariosphaeria phaeospora TaxID=100035 RepID=A0A7C8IDE2_9PLEO|nr:major facilitator superfamily domain-containing protein [Massariosphaeria phaeospora]
MAVTSKTETGDPTPWSATKRAQTKQEEGAIALGPSRGNDAKPPSWRALPRKDQLLVLTLARLSEPLSQASLGAYVFYQLQFFDSTLPNSTISYQAGIIHAAFPAAQFLTAMLWGWFADSENGGRKRVIWIGLLGTVFSMIGFGFSENFPIAVMFRVLGGVLNGNIGVMRTMTSEIVKEKKFQPKAFMILPMTYNVGIIIGPILGGILADPVASYPSLFGPNSRIGGKDGVYWMRKWPYALPNLVGAIFLLISTLIVFLFMEETSDLCKHRPDYGLRLGRMISRFMDRCGHPIRRDECATVDVEHQQPPTTLHIRAASDERRTTPRLPFRKIWTPRLVMTLATYGLLIMHVGTFNSLWFTYLSTPRYDPAHPYPQNYRPHGFIHFTGGLALPPPLIGIALAILGVIGITMQLALYPRVLHHLGTEKSYRIFLALFPVAYTLVPFLSTVPSWSAPPGGVSGILIWIAISTVLFIQVLGRTFALTTAAILINNSCPHPSVLGTVHGIGQSVSSFMRTLGPIVGGWLFGRGLDIGAVGLAWWILAVVAILGCGFGQFVKEGNGQDIWLERESEEDR